MSDRISKSMETVGSPDSILATRDWLDCTAAARSCCVRRLRFRRAFSPSDSLRRNSINAAASADRSRNSLASPTFQPRLVSLAFLLARIVILPKTPLAGCNHILGRGARLLGKHRPNHDRISVRPVDNSPIRRTVPDAQLMASLSDSRHRPRMGHSQRLATLQSSKQHPGLDPCGHAEWRGLDLPIQPYQRLVSCSHEMQYMSVLTYRQLGFGNLTRRCSVRRLSSRRLQPGQAVAKGFGQQAARRPRAAADRGR